MSDADIGPVQLDGHSRIFVRLTEAGRADAMLWTIEGTMNQIIHEIPTLHMDRIPIEMQDHVVGVALAWLRLLWKVSRFVFCYQEVVGEAAEAPKFP